MSADITRSYLRHRKAGVPAKIAYAMARDEYRMPAFHWLEKLEHGNPVSGTVGPFTVHVRIDPDDGMELGDDDVTGVFTDTFTEGCVPTGGSGREYKWYRPSNYTLEYTLAELRATMSKHNAQLAYGARVNAEMAEDRERRWWIVSATVEIDGHELATSSLAGIDETPSYDARPYLLQVAEEQIDDAIAAARDQIPAEIARISTVAAEMHRAAAPTVSLVKASA